MHNVMVILTPWMVMFCGKRFQPDLSCHNHGFQSNCSKVKPNHFKWSKTLVHISLTKNQLPNLTNRILESFLTPEILGWASVFGFCLKERLDTLPHNVKSPEWNVKRMKNRPKEHVSEEKQHRCIVWTFRIQEMSKQDTKQMDPALYDQWPKFPISWRLSATCQKLVSLDVYIEIEVGFLFQGFHFRFKKLCPKLWIHQQQWSLFQPV